MKAIVTGNFTHNHKEYKKGSEFSFAQLEELMTEKQAQALVDAGCLKVIEGEEAKSEEPAAEAPKAEELPAIAEESEEAQAEGKKKKGKK